MSTQYNECAYFFLPQNIDLERMRKALYKVIETRPVLRDRVFIDENGVPQQYVDTEMEIPVEIKNIKDEDVDAYVASYVRPFSLASGEPLCRFELVQTPTRKMLMHDFHHIILDGMSIYQFRVDLQNAYEGNELEPEAKSLFDYAVEEKEHEKSQAFAEAADYYTGKFAEAEFPTLSDNAQAPLGDFIYLSTIFPKGDIPVWCRQHRIKDYILAQAAFALVVSRMSRQRKVGYSSILHGRFNRAYMRSYGMFVKTVPVLGDVNPDMAVADYVNAMLEEWKSTYRMADYSFPDFCSRTGVKETLLFSYQGGSVKKDYIIDGGKVEWDQVPPTKTNFALSFLLYPRDDDYEFLATAADTVYDRAFMQRFVNAVWATILDIMDKWDGGKVKDISIVSEDEARQLIKMGTGDKMDVDSDATFVSLFMKQAAETPDKIAVADANGTYTYSQLDNLSGALAARIAETGVAKGNAPFVSVMLGRQKEFLVATIGVEKAGCAYVPLDYDYPNDRLVYMLEDSESAALITTHDIFDEKNGSGDFKDYKGCIIYLDDFLSSADSAAANTFNAATPDSLAYMIYTSGSTGKPKGVMIPQSAKAQYVQAIVKEWRMDADSRICCHPSFSFDASVEALYPVLVAGGTLYPVPDEARKDFALLHDFIVGNGITGGNFTTQLGQMLLQMYPDLPLQYLVVGGEKMTVIPKCKCRYINAYGPTEFTVMSTFHEVRKDNKYTNIPIGRPIDNQLALVVDADGHLLPQGVAGELCMSGSQMARGYWHRPDLTAERFSSLTINGEEIKVYHTGDLVKYNEDGLIEYVGRIDSQVKLRGFRIELGEIESLIGQYDGILMKSVTVKKIGGVEHLCAYYTASKEIDSNALRDSLAEKLTDYMVPTAYMQLDKMPLTPNGKVNTRALPDPVVSAEETVAPETDTEKRIFALASNILNTEEFGVTTNLVGIGLSSISAMRLVALIQKEMNVTLNMGKVMLNPTVRSMAKLAGAATADAGPTLEAVAPREFYPITESQRGIYIDWQMNPDTTQYNVPQVIRLKFADIDVDRMVAAVKSVIDAHPYVKSHLVQKDGDVMLQRRDNVAFDVAVTTLDSEPSAEYFQRKVRPFNLLGEDLIRTEITRTPGNVYLMIDVHHVVYDGMSGNVFFQDVFNAYDGTAPAGEVVSAFDYSIYEEQLLKGDAYQQAQQFFDGVAEDACAVSYPDSPCPDGVKSAAVDASLESAGIDAFCSANGVTVSSFLQAALALVLQRVTREDCPLFLTVSAGRSVDMRLMRSVGMFVKTLPVAFGVKADMAVADFVKSLHQQLLDSYARDFYPYTRFVERHSVHPEVMFSYQGGVLEQSLSDSIEFVPLHLDITKFPIDITTYPEGDSYHVTIDYDGIRYGKDDMTALARAICAAAEGMATAEKVSAVSLLTAGEETAVAKASEGKAMSVDGNATFPSMFVDQSARTPEKTAVVDKNGGYTYLELNRLSATLAENICTLGIDAGKSPFVAVMLGYQKEFLVAAIGVERAGYAYVPLDYDYPNDRLLYMLEDSGSSVIVTSHAIFDEKNSGGDFDGFGGKILFIDDFTGKENAPADCSFNRAVPDGLAYMIYTSGSTGKPKGVMIPHSAKANFLAFIAGEWGLSENSRISCHSNFSFDASIEDLYPVLTVGGTLYVVPQDARKDMVMLHSFIVDNGITGGCYTTQLGQMLLQMYPDLPVEYLVVGGEKMTVAPNCRCRLINTYGPTEFTVDATFFEVTPGQEYGNIPIGRPLDNLSAFVADACGHLLPAGMAGELCMAGPQMARGYWNRPELTADKFTFVYIAGKRVKVYRTGDLVRYNADGQIEYLGRIDSQVKLRGFRIELGEIETLIGGYEGVRMTSVVVREIGGVEHLCAYFTADRVIDTSAMQEYLAGKLTDYMVPTAYMQLEEMPLTPNGKVNQRALPEPQLSETGQDSFVAPEGEIEVDVAEAFAVVLKREKVGANDDFFKCGGTSLSAIKVVAALMNKGYSVTYKDLFKYKTPRGVAIFIDVMKNVAAPVVSQTIVVDKGGELPQSAYASVLDTNTLDALRGGGRLPVGNVVLTGATGYMGMHMLYELLQNESGVIYCVLRGKKKLTPEQRLRTLFFYYFDGIDEGIFNSRIRVIEGDLTDGHSLDTLPDDVDTVFNCAANVKHFSAGDDIEKVNVESVRHIVDWCVAHNARLVHVSTVSVAGQSIDGVPAAATLLNERMFDYGQSIDNQYVKSKYDAEEIVLAAIRDRGLVAKIMRVGNLAPRNSDGEFQINFKSNAFMGRIAALAALRSVTYGFLDEPCEFSPIDAVCRAIRLLSQTPKEMVVFHPYNNHSIPFGDVLEILHTVGVDVKAMEEEEFNEVVQKMLKDESVAAKLQPLFAYNEGDTKHVVRWIGFDNSYTTQVLHRIGFSWPYTSWDYAERFVKVIHDFNFV